MRNTFLLAVAAVMAGLAGCTDPPTGNGNGNGNCVESECASRCRSLGHARGGTCIDGGCICRTGGTGDAGDAGDTGDTRDTGSDPWGGPGPSVRMTGTVWSPGRLVPISGALVYFRSSEPPAIPPGAYPQACENLPGRHAVLSNPDGTFEVQVRPGTYWRTVQKGQFRRVRVYEVPDAPGTTVAVDAEYTTLPAKTDEAVGDTIPSIAVSWALPGGDHIEDVLAKMTLGETDGRGVLVRGTEPFDIYNVAGYPPVSQLLTDLDRMLQYHIIFFPCTIGGQGTLEDPTAFLTDPAVLENIRQYVSVGGKLYATDMMYDIFEQAMPDFLDICGDDARINDGDFTAWRDPRTAFGWTSRGQAIAPDLAAWLSALGIDPNDLELAGNFVWIENMIDPIDPSPTDPSAIKTWVTGDFILEPGRTLPLTVTWPYGFGKVLFSTYHTDGQNPHPGLYAQEYILLYLIMELGVCQGEVY